MEVIYDLSEIQEVARMLLTLPGDIRILTFSGNLGAGKTTLIQALSRELGVVDQVSSPTFSIIQQYQTRKGGWIHHLDLYRIESDREAINAGVEESLFSGDWCLVEWPEKAPSLFAENTLHLHLAVAQGDRRKMFLKIPSKKL
ncbi:MAG: tRNA (adenosine(37)-N6)-threonylcarbamoyltransferase complex ATPase subunit type 1 TsaE [Bacteroidota bacterium]|nr:tRNA (adenosine(37)-N6)-threonylcarbamoyltransferase complex ATPase subunit type 1 TsaE [Bacteroidota bacterium]